jgi:hypothetical protein
MTLLLAILSAIAPVVLDAGPLKVEIHTARAAQRFYVIDQLSKWNLFSHGQYRRRLGPFDADDEAVLAKHATVRKAHGYGDMDTTFYLASDFDAALAGAVKARLLTPAEADVEREVMKRFAPRIDAFLDADQPLVEAAVAQLLAHRAELTVFAKRASRFTGERRVEMPLFLVPSGEKGMSGGGANGGVLTAEVAEGMDTYYTVVHESWHAFVQSHYDALIAAAKRTPGLNDELLSEGLAYAVMPGLYHDGKDDKLARQVGSDLDRGARTDEHERRLAAFNRYGLALRPLLATALDDRRETLVSFLPRACDAFRVLASLDLGATAPRLASFFFFGAKDDGLMALAIGKPANAWGRPHGAEGYAVLSHAQPNDVVVLRFTLADLPSVAPDAIRDLLPATIDEIRATLQAGNAVEREATRRGWKIILLAAPDAQRLGVLTQQSKSMARVLPAEPAKP